MCSSHREVVAHFEKSEVKVIGQGQGHFEYRRILKNLRFWSNLKNSATSVFIHREVVAHFKKSEVKVIGQGQGHFNPRRAAARRRTRRAGGCV